MSGGQHVPSSLSTVGDPPEPPLLAGFRGAPGVWRGWGAGLRCCGAQTRGSATADPRAPGLPAGSGPWFPPAAAAGVPANTCT